MTEPVIQTPKGKVVYTKGGKAKLEFNPGFQPKWQRRYSSAQKYVDSEVLRKSEPFIPLLTGTLIKTGILGTDIGSGLVQWIAPYSKAQYYLSRPPGRPTGPLRGPFWFERMKKINGDEIIKGAKQRAGKG